MPRAVCAVHPGTIAMADFRKRLRLKVLTRCTRHLGDIWTLHAPRDKLFR
jgi:hypothetical protein